MGMGFLKEREFNYNVTGFKLPFEDLMIKDQPIHQHLSLLYFIVKEFKLKKVLELGTQFGYSTTAFGYAVKELGGKLYSIDIVSCPYAHDKMTARKLTDNWKFYENKDDLTLDWKEDIDCLFVDSKHSYDQVTRELKKFEPFVKKGGFIILHDMLVFEGLLRGIDEYFDFNKNKYSEYRWFNDCGLEVIRKH